MALEVEDGTAKSDAESYVSVAEASAYHSLRGNTLWATMSEGEMEAALRRATDYLVQTYRDQWAGYRATTTQALDWPREEVQIKDAPALSYYASDQVPQGIKNACALMAFKAASGELDADQQPPVAREKVGPIEVEYAAGARPSVRYPAIDKMLEPFLRGGRGSIPVARA